MHRLLRSRVQGPRSRVHVVSLCLVLMAVPAAAQDTQPVEPIDPIEQISFEEAVQRAITRNPTIEQASAGILRAEALLLQVRSLSLPSVDANLTARTLGRVQQFAGEDINPRTQLNTSFGLTVPLLTPLRWAQRAQAQDQVVVARRSAEDIRREIAVAAAQAYLVIITQRRVLELNLRSRDTARAHFDYARQRFEGGVGSRLNAVRAQQEFSTDEARVEDARLAIRRAQEALGVLVAADGPVDAGAEPAFDIPATLTAEAAASERTDIRLLEAQTAAAERVADDSRKDYLPEVLGVFSPQILTPSGLFTPAASWTAAIVFSVPLFDSGQRRGRSRERQALLTSVRAEQANVLRDARAEIRAALEAVRSNERALKAARAAAEQANEVLGITDIAFRAGATTNIEVIDAQRRARDAETTAAITEDSLRRARLELLVAIGRFPQ